MTFLCIDTTTNILTVALYIDGKTYFKTGAGAKLHNASLLPYIEKVLVEGSITLRQVDHFLCVNGPGSFTGIRIGVSVINAFAQAFIKEVFTINSLDIVAYSANTAKKILALIDCGHNTYYGAEYENDFTKRLSIGVYEQSLVDVYDGLVVVQTEESNLKALIDVALHTIKATKPAVQAEPFYIKKSQAERIADGE